MRLSEIHRQIALSEPDAWNVITCWGYGSGPSYLYKWAGEDAGGDLKWQSHSLRAVLKSDVRIGMAVGLDSALNNQGSGTAPWSDEFPDESVSWSFADVLFNGALVDRELLVTVDGGRASLPAPHSSESGYWVDRTAYDIARAADSLEGAREFERYFQQLGWEIRGAPDPGTGYDWP